MGEGSTVRAFLAFEIPAMVRERLAAAIGQLRRELPRARWVRPEGVHLTVKFLGESSPKMLDDLAASLAPEIGQLARVSVALGGSGFFPNARRPRVAWLGGRAEGAGEIVERVESAANALGWEAERRPWSPHLTLARLRDGWPRHAVERFLAWGEQFSVASFDCRELVLFCSELRSDGAVYTPLHRVPLSAAGS